MEQIIKMGKAARKRAAEHEKNVESEDSQNVNGNCQTATVTRSVASTSKSGSIRKKNVEKPKRSKLSKRESKEQEQTCVERVQFAEELDTVEFDVHTTKDDFLSDGEVDSEEEQDPMEQNKSFNESVGSMNSEKPIDDDEEEMGIEQDDEGSEDEDVGHRSRPSSVVKRKTKSIEEQISTLTSTLTTMQDLMIKKGFFDEEKNANKNRGKGKGK